LFGSDWSEDQIRRFEEIKSDISAFQYESVEATLAFLTFKILNNDSGRAAARPSRSKSHSGNGSRNRMSQTSR
jgi:hypothetical protein